MTGPNGVPYVTCETTGKRGYRSRRDARTARTRTKGEASKLLIYECSACGRFHLGHLPRTVVRGEQERATIRRPGDPDTPTVK